MSPVRTIVYCKKCGIGATPSELSDRLCKPCRVDPTPRSNRRHLAPPSPTGDASLDLLLDHYGITGERYNAMLAEQEGRCAICRREPSTKRLWIDHNHATGAVRGLLCNACNSALGLLGDSPKRLAAASEYLRERGHYGTEEDS